MIKNTKFLDVFPKIQYDINNVGFGAGSHETVVDIFFRFGVVKDVINNISSYTVYELDDSDTPEILAEKTYGDAGAGWIILYSNKIIDPQFGWPLSYDAFSKMIVDKYGSTTNAQTTTHHYEKIITRTNQFFGTTEITRFIIDNEKLTDNALSVPYDYYDGLAGSSSTYDIDGKTVIEKVEGLAVSNYDYELKLNDDKRTIKVIKAEYYDFIMREFKNLTNQTYAF